jgi:quinol monooxygenase YgiN
LSAGGQTKNENLWKIFWGGRVAIVPGVIDWKRKKARRQDMATVALLVRLEAKPGKEAEMESFLRSGLAIVQQEPATTTWYAIRMGASTFGIFDTFPDDAGRQAHLSGRVAAALMAKAPDLLAKPPQIEKVDVLAAKIP